MSLKFDNELINAISEVNTLNIEAVDVLLDDATCKTIEMFCKINQYYTFNEQSKIELRAIYSNLLSMVKLGKRSPLSIEKMHYEKLNQWLLKTNPFSENIFLYKNADNESVACSEYSALFQLDILKIDVNSLFGPILDVGCGKEANLVHHLQGFENRITGIDRFSFSEENLIKIDWLEFNYGIDAWGTVISNLGFSNHFKHHNLRKDGNYVDYAKTYMNIIKSLKIGGKFHYAPDLPFIELYLDTKKYKIEKFDIGFFDFKTTVIMRLE